MASGVVRCAICLVIEDRNLELQSSRIKYLKSLGADLLQKITGDDTMVAAFDKFSVKLNDKIELICQSCASYRSYAAKREKMWCAFELQYLNYQRSGMACSLVWG